MYYNKDKLKEELEPEQIYDLLDEWGGQPTWGENFIISDTICHNPPGEGSHKLYYYFGTRLFVCYTGCQQSSFDIFDLCIKVHKIQKNKIYELYDAMCFVANYFGLSGVESSEEDDSNLLKDWNIFQRYKEVLSKQIPTKQCPQLKEYNPEILSHLSYPIIAPWEQEGIKKEVCKRNRIGYYPVAEQITIPHFDIEGRFIGLRGRFLADEDAEKYGKYRPAVINRISYRHPLSANLYNLNNSKENIQKIHTAIVFEGEKSSLLYQSYYGYDNDISVACCGSSLSSFQVNLLLRLGVKEIIFAFDRQFQEIGDDEFTRLKKKLVTAYKKYSQYVKISAIFDKEMITNYKDSPIDQGREKFEYLLRNKITPR